MELDAANAALLAGFRDDWLLVVLAIAAVFSLLLNLTALWLLSRRTHMRIDAAQFANLREIIANAERIIREETGRLRAESDLRGDALREQVQRGMDANRGALDIRLDQFGQLQGKGSESLRFEVGKSVAAFGEGLKGDVAGLSKAIDDKIGLFTEGLRIQQGAFEKSTGENLVLMADNMRALSSNNADAHLQLRKTVEERLEKLRAENEVKLEQMRATVDEKLQSTLEKRLGESFKHVSDRLEQVHRGLGEMQTLAVGVGDLRKVLSNVKDRGGWAEMQLGALLDDLLAPDQFEANVRVDPASQQTVEFAVRMPGGEPGTQVYLPIDAKFPKEDYERLVLAWDSGDADGAREALSALERTIESEAKKIGDKYVKPPFTTDFAILYLPTEGLFAEAMRRPGLVARVQSKFRVAIAGPTTLAALLTSLQMGFRTLAIQQRSSEVWKVLGHAKAEFERYGGVWQKLSKQLQTAQNTVEEAGQRTRAVSRRLKEVEVIEPPGGLLQLDIAPLADEVAEPV